MRGMMLVVAMLLVGGTGAEAYWKKQDFLGDAATQKAVLKSLEGWRFEQGTTERDCIDQLLGTKEVVDRARRGRGSVGSSHVSLWKYCAATYLPADTPEECRASEARYSKLAGRDRKRNGSIVGEYLKSFCGPATGTR